MITSIRGTTYLVAVGVSNFAHYYSRALHCVDALQWRCT